MAHNGGRLQVGVPGEFLGPQYAGQHACNAAAYCDWYISPTGTYGGTRTITTITNANPGVVTTSTPHGFVTGEKIQLDIWGQGWWVPNQGVTVVATVIDANRFSIGINTSSFSPYTITSGWAKRAGFGSPDYVNQSTGAFKQPPANCEWWTSQLRMSSKNGTEPAAARQWVLTWEGNCNPVLTIEDGFSNLYETLHLISSTGNRRIYEIRKAVSPTAADGPPNNHYNTWNNRSGENGFSLLCRLKLQNQVGEVNNVRLYRLSDEARMLAGKTHTADAISMYQGTAGVLRFVDACGGGVVPGTTDVAAVYPDNWWSQLSRNLHGGPNSPARATTISENYWLVTPRADKAAVEDRMALAFETDTSIIYHSFALTKGAVTTLTKTNHGFSNGELIQRIPIYYGDGNRDAINYGITEARAWYGGAGGSGLRMAWPVTVVDANTLTIPLDTSGDNFTNGQTCHWMRPTRLKYGPTGTTHYIHDGSGCWNRVDGTQSLVDGFDREGVFMVPLGKTVSSAHFVTGQNQIRGIHPKFIVELCNEVSAHAYVTVADWSSTSYLNWFLGYLRDNLNPGLDVFVELGNEPWNGAGYFYGSGLQNTWLYWASDWSGLSPNWTSYQVPYERSRNIHGHLHRAMHKHVKPLFAVSGRNVKTCLGMQVGAGTVAEHLSFAKGLSNYPAGDEPGHNTDLFAHAPYDALVYYSGTEAKPGATVPQWLKQCLDWFYGGQKQTAFNYMRDLRINIDSSSFVKFLPGGICKQLHDLYGKGYTHYEGGYGYHRSQWYDSNDQAACIAAGYGASDAAKLYWDFYRSTQHAEMVTHVFQKWLDNGCQFPAWFTAHSPHTEARASPGWAGFNWGLWPVNSAYYATEIIPTVTAWRDLNNGVLGATLVGRGYLTATASGAKNTSASPVGRGALAATGTKSAQVFYGLSNYAENAVLDFLLRATGTSPTTVYLALHTGNTGEDGTTHEVSTSTGYARTAITFDAPSGGQIVSAAQVAFGPFSSAPGQITNFSIWTAASGGNCLATGAFTSSASPLSGYSLNVPAGGIQITAN